MTGEIYSGDIDRFVEAQEAIANGADPVEAFQAYIDQGSPGLKDFMDERIISAQALADMVAQSPEVYATIPEIRAMIPDIKAAVEKSFANMTALYPETRLPDVYLLVGRRNSGGTASNHGLMIGVEVYWDNPDIYPFIVAHEMIHFQQDYPLLQQVTPTLLVQSVKEGSADFIGELISGGIINGAARDYGLPNECQLWTEFQPAMDGTDLSGWLYGITNNAGPEWDERPNDLGYFMGYRITASYYDQAEDKKAALRDILTIDDFHDFLEKSGYPVKMEACQSN